MYPKILLNLIEELKKLPGVGAKTAERYAFEIIDRDHQDIEAFANALLKIKDGLKTCTICGNITEETYCDICKDKHRDRSVICVVSHPKDIIAMEKMGEFHGVYHVLNGVISTFKGILPEDINIESLIKRVDEHVTEVIIATNPTIEGETTALYIAKKLQLKEANVTRLASGLPMGGHLDYADEMTLIKAMEGRKKI
ncbi:MAG: recombination protein RecR [Firmicutes bacterium HGW-Firmicutes-20]|jgi:recombination protein RecR|nr:recombination mediator RecR [Methanosarcinaceae archaeon]PKM63485.1 MAG: recombination protein RecR [Firmicutes bacterium HGW-Firmicutes-20]PKM86345.1 MAG: recombination protein RecR [Firmicutes bacterium HGW-Firmicutes-10]